MSLANSKSFFGSKSKISVLSIVPFSLFTFFVPDTNSILYYPYIPLLVTPPLISGSGLPSDIPVDEKDLGV